LLAIQGVNMRLLGVVLLINAGIPELSRFVANRTFDTFLPKPASVFAQVASSRIEIAALGDILLGLVLIIGYGVITQVDLLAVALFLVALAVGMVLMYCFTLMPFILAFYIFDADKVARAAAFFFLDSGLYPTGVIGGKLRLVLLTVWPGLFIGAVPADVLRGLHWEWVLVGLVVAAVWLTIALWLFHKSLRKYESANLVGAR
jgi:ABC-2 type transport system permease protein